MLMSKRSFVVKQSTRLYKESEPVALASQMELARQALLKKMFENKEVEHYIAKQILMELANGGDFSEIFLLKNTDERKELLYKFFAEFAQYGVCFDGWGSDSASIVTQKVVQGTNVVQLYTDVDCGNFAVSPQAHEIMYELPFLPVYLISASERIQNQLALVGRLDSVYKAELQFNRLQLQGLRQKMISNNTGLVAFVAQKYKTTSLCFEDLMQEGMVGLIKAVDRFDAERGNCFSTYAIFWIKQAVSRLIVKQDKVVPLPVALAEKSSPVFEAMRNTYLQHERWPTLVELKACCNLTEYEIKTISSYYQSTYVNEVSNDGDDDAMSMMEKMQQRQFTLPLERLIEIDLASYMNKVVATLPEKQANILNMRFGLKNHTEMTLQAVADHLQVTRERVRQIQNEALCKLKQQFGFDLMSFLEPNDT